MTSLHPTSTIGGEHDFDAGLLQYVQRKFAHDVAFDTPRTLFSTANADKLFDIYLEALPEAGRQSHKCNCCRQFITRFGGLVYIDDNGNTNSALWDDSKVDDFYKEAVARLRCFVEKQDVEGVFVTSQRVLGTPVTGEWTHLNVDLGKPTHTSRLLSAGQVMAAKKEDRKNVFSVLIDWPIEALDTAVRVLESDTLYRSEKVLGAGLWLRDLKRKTSSRNPRTNNNLLWLAIALAPDGFCHPRSSMLGTLMEDIIAGLPYDDIAAKFKAKMRPDQYQRPQAAPTGGNIKRAEEIMEKLGLAPSLERRFARLEDITFMHWPRHYVQVEGVETSAPGKQGVFAHLKAKGTAPKVQPVTLPKVTMTWDKFSRTVLPAAELIEFWVPGGNNSFCALTSAVHAEAPPILQWDMEDFRQPVAWYQYVGGSAARTWNMTPHSYVKVNCITCAPSHWNPALKITHHDDAMLFILDGARDTNQRVTGCLFPEILKAELREVRATIEAYSQSATLAGREEQSASGIYFSKTGAWNAQVRVTSQGQTAEYVIDRRD